MSISTQQTLDEAYLCGLEKYIAAHPRDTQHDFSVVAQWLMNHEGFGLERRIARKEIAKRLAKAANRKRTKNEQGKRVHSFLSAMLPFRNKKGKMVQKQFWGERKKVSASFAHASVNQFHKQTEGMAASLFIRAEDLNANNPNLKSNPIQLELDFNYVKTSKTKQRIETVPVDENMQMVVEAKDKGMSAARKRAKDL